MDLKRPLFVLALLLLSLSIWGQTITLTPSSPSPSTFTFSSPSTAGGYPANISYTSQSVKYTGNSQYTSCISVALTSGTIPSGMEIDIQTAYQSFWEWLFGILGGGISGSAIQLSNTPTNIITNITTTSSITRAITMSINITNFALLHPGTNPLTLTYTISAQ